MNHEKEILQTDIDFIAKSISEELDILSGKKILLTGGAGFLGYEFTHLFSKVGVEDDREPVDLTIYEYLFSKKCCPTPGSNSFKK